ncbi:polysaccharide pyruvyl transferase family protein [Xanthobacter sp. AM11]|uniref:polysaccharide pyruvyl transferase family protein n=1 Tax=Xanthobacter sp. AM11 TaxID=3380643 RepID=UPI0039BEE915
MKSLRIGLLTYHFSDNFGAVLQAYGLRAWLMEQGHRVEFIPYHPKYVEEGGDFIRPWDPRMGKVNAKIAYLKLSTLQRRIFGNRQQAAAFDAFRRDALGITGTTLVTKAEVEAYLQRQSEPFDLISVGSDQIWNPSDQYGLDPVYFGAMEVGHKTRRISYAPSFGRDSLDERFIPMAQQFLRHLDDISVREASGAELVEKLTGRAVTCVPDPTFLLRHFSKIVAEAELVEPDQVFCYALRNSVGIREVTEMIGKELATGIISPYNAHRRWKEIGRTIHPSPKGWLSTIQKSRFVVTNSFHGTAFAILLQRPFIVVGLPGTKSSLNARARHLLASVGLSNRFVADGNLNAARDMLGQEIDWLAVDQRVAEIQSVGVGFLTRQIELAGG